MPPNPLAFAHLHMNPSSVLKTRSTPELSVEKALLGSIRGKFT